MTTEALKFEDAKTENNRAATFWIKAGMPPNWCQLIARLNLDLVRAGWIA